MPEYIKREEALEIVKRTSGDYATAFAEIRKIPTADVVSVVRCKDCKYAYINPSGAILCSSSMQMKKQDGFCDYGDINDRGVDIETD